SASTLPLTNHGMMGIGNWTTAFNVANPINAKLDIDGDLRIRTVTQDNTLTQILAIDPDDHNRVHWIDGSNLGGNVTADNGIFVNAAGVVQLGVPCLNVNGNVNTTGILATQFTEDRVIANRDFNFWIGSLDTETGGVGFGGQPASTAFCNTGNTVEISANMKSTKYGNTNASGLRLTQLTSASPTLANGTNGVDNTRVLTVDQDGDVVLVDAVGGTGTVTADNGLSINPANNIQLGQACGSASSTANLLSDREIPLNDFNLIFSGQGTTGNNIGIGTTCTPIAKLQVDKTGTTTMSMSRGIYVHNSEQAANYSVGAQIYTDANSPYSRSIDVLATNSTIRNTGIHTSGWGGQDSYGINSGGGMATVRNVGVNGSAIAPGASVGWGVTGSATTSGGNTGENVGVYGSATGSLTQNFGGRFLANGSSGINYGVFAQAPNTSSTLGPHFAGYFAGDLLYTGQFGVSDQMFKKNIDSITDALSIISQLLPRTYLNDVINYSKLGFNDSKQYGFVAQEVELVLPELVGKGIHPDEYDTNGVKINSSFDFKTLNYQAFIPILTKGIQEQQLVIDSMSNTIQIQDSINNDLETRLAYLESCIRNANICEESNRTLNNELNNATNQKSIELINSNSIVLDQNMPNPFAENTVINYNIPNDVMEAKLLFYDLNGRIIKELIIEERGESKLTVYGNNLKTGVYTYSLIADGELIATKKMVKK
ncbi:MAG: T9SS type A sorting domain-containing protein, partial [Flavobacteriales bacterium]|nr:T9SS type A sorting domain-containing protein [Flavobacteriales bacterium]